MWGLSSQSHMPSGAFSYVRNSGNSPHSCIYLPFFPILTVRTLEPWTPWLYFHFIFTLFVLFFTYFVVIFYIFPELTNHICEPKQWHRHFFSFFPCFYCSTQHVWDAFRCTVLHVFQITLAGFLAGINLRSLKSDSGIQFTVKWPKLQQIILVSTTFI